MSQSTIKPINLPALLRQFRQKHRLSINKLSKLSGISRRTLTRIEAGFYSSHGPALPVPSVAEGSAVEGSAVEVYLPLAGTCFSSSVATAPERKSKRAHFAPFILSNGGFRSLGFEAFNFVGDFDG